MPCGLSPSSYFHAPPFPIGTIGDGVIGIIIAIMVVAIAAMIAVMIGSWRLPMMMIMVTMLALIAIMPPSLTG